MPTKPDYRNTLSPEAKKKYLEKLRKVLGKQMTLSDDVPGKMRLDRVPPGDLNDENFLLRMGNVLGFSPYHEGMIDLSDEEAQKKRKKFRHGTR